MIETAEKIKKITDLFIIKADDINRINETGDQCIVTLNEGQEFEQIKFAECTFNEQPTTTDDGEVYQQKLQIVIAGDDTQLFGKLKYYQGNKPVVKFGYNTGEEKLIGNKYNYCLMTIAPSSENFETKLVITFTRKDYKPALFVVL